MPLIYHAGQIEVQQEANTRDVADRLAHWVGPVGEFCSVADLILLTAMAGDGALTFAAVSGRAPLVEVEGPSTLRLPASVAALTGGAPGVLAGGIAVNLAQLRRARLNGRLSVEDDGVYLDAGEAFTNCRKYVAPSVALADGLHAGPVGRKDVAIDDAWLADVVARAETAFLASVSPDGQPDVSHRGGPPGFFELDAAARSLTWQEFVGDGMLKSAGNIRATGHATLLVVDLDSGDAAELSGTAAYTTLRRAREPRQDALQRHGEHFPVQGAMTLQVTRTRRLSALMQPRRRVEKAQKITSASDIDDQAPQ